MIRAIAFDLDDTLLDTSGLLVPAATQHSFKILIQHGLKLSLAECEKQRLEMIRTVSHKDVFLNLALLYGSAATQAVVPQAIAAFYEPPLPANLPLLPGARQNIDYLKKNNYLLYVVTAGADATQRGKVKALGIQDDFLKVYVIDSLHQQRKKAAFLDIIKLNAISNKELLCIGNSLTSEIYDAINIGAKSCYFEFGDERGKMSSVKSEQPDYHIYNHKDLISTCHL